MSSGATNWEDAWFRTFYAADGSPAAITPNTVVFFTDGIPTQDRILNRGGGGVLPALPALPGPGWFTSNGSDYSQVAFNRADYYATERRVADDTRLVGVGVGPGIGTLTGPIPPSPPNPSTTSQWMPAPAVAYNKTGEERTTFTYQQSGFTYYKWTDSYEERSSFDEQSHTAPWQRRKTSPVGAWGNTSKANFDSNSQTGGPYEYRINSSGWVSSTKALYHAGNTNPTDTDGWKRSNPSGTWVAMTGLAQYNANNTTSDETDGVRIVSAWAPISKATYDGGNTTNDDTDGYRRVTNGTFSGSITKAEYDGHNTTADSSDGFRRTNPPVVDSDLGGSVQRSQRHERWDRRCADRAATSSPRHVRPTMGSRRPRTT